MSLLRLRHDRLRVDYLVRIVDAWHRLSGHVPEIGPHMARVGHLRLRLSVVRGGCGRWLLDVAVVGVGLHIDRVGV